MMKGQKGHWCQLLFAQTLLALATVQGGGEAVTIFQGFVSQLGFDFMLLLDASIHGTAFASDPVVWSNWPRCLTRFKATAKKREYHPLQKITRRIWRPTTWREMKPLACPSTKTWFDHAEQHQMHGGVFVPVHTDGQKSMLILAGRENPNIEKPELHVLAKAAFGSTTGGVSSTYNPNLSVYEKHALYYSGQGMSEAEIALLLDNSPNGIKKTLGRVRRKLRTNKTTHAVAIALRDGLII